MRCNHYYHYFFDERFGLCYLRLQSWFPYSIRVGLVQGFRNRDLRQEWFGTTTDPAERRKQ